MLHDAAAETPSSAVAAPSGDEPTGVTPPAAGDPSPRGSRSDDRRRGPPRGALERRLTWLTAFRLVVLSTFFLVTEALYLRNVGAGGPSRFVASITLAVAFALAAVYGVILRKGRRLEAVTHVQLATDQLTWTVMVYLSGGATSGATSLYGLTCLSGAVLLGIPGAVTAAAMGIACYLLMCAGFAYGLLLPPADQNPASYVVSLADILFPAFSTVMAITVVTVLASYLAARLRATGRGLAVATARAEQAEQLAVLGRVAAALAHEIRNPLGSIRGSIELLRTGGKLETEDAELCSIIEREAGRLDDLVTDMVDLSRPRLPAIGPIDIAAVALDVVTLGQRSGRGAGVALRYDGPASLVVAADGSQMKQIVWNLVRNAIQVSPPGAEVLVGIEVGASGEAVLSVRDQGPGVAAAERARIFEPFYSKRTRGTGIGLAVVKRIAEGHDFALEVDSLGSDGTVFRMRIPRSALALLALVAGCATGRDWVNPPAPETDDWVALDSSEHAAAEPRPPSHVTLPASAAPSSHAAPEAAGASSALPMAAGDARLFRNTYYDFPAERAFAPVRPADAVGLFDADCKRIALVSRAFHDQVCLQGSGRLESGETVSFARRDCECAALCPRSSQHICFERLDPARFPHGRGALGQPVTPRRTVAVDSSVVPLGTVLYIPEFHGLRDLAGHAHDGCFVAEDRGSRVVGSHVDIFTGDPALTRAWNEAVPSNGGVHVILDDARCAHLKTK